MDPAGLPDFASDPAGPREPPAQSGHEPGPVTDGAAPGAAAAGTGDGPASPPQATTDAEEDAEAQRAQDPFHDDWPYW